MRTVPPYRWSDDLSAIRLALFVRGGWGIADRSLPDVWREPWCSVKPHGHPAEKPENLVRRMLRAGPRPSLVLDPFMGSGTTLAAARSLGIRSVGIEADERWCAVAASRLAQAEIAFPEPPAIAVADTPTSPDLFGD